MSSSPFSVLNVRLFLLFRVFFNARFYYPVFTILFLDFGLNLEQFATLNIVWAATIVLLEVPTGALADTLGRRNLLRISSILLLIEIGLICFMPLGNNAVVFWLLVLNRIISGAAEAFASGADEALAYDSLAQAGKSDLWPRVLEVLMRCQSIAFIFALLLGSFLYDANSVNSFVHYFGFELNISQLSSMRFPLYLMLVSACAVVVIAWSMKELDNQKVTNGQESWFSRSVLAFSKIGEAAVWIKTSHLAFLIICAGLVFDNVIRMILTLNSEYYRIIELPTWSFGMAGATFSIIGIFIPSLAKYLVHSHSAQFNFSLAALLCFAGLMGMTYVWPVWGLIAVAMLFCAMYLVGFMSSHYLNQVTSSGMRATVLSFKGLAYNLAYGLAGFFYSLLAGKIAKNVSAQDADITVEALNKAVFVSTLQYFPWYFLFTLVCFGILVFSGKKRLRWGNTSGTDA